jgi:hypothetical protein
VERKRDITRELEVDGGREREMDEGEREREIKSEGEIDGGRHGDVSTGLRK